MPSNVVRVASEQSGFKAVAPIRLNGTSMNFLPEVHGLCLVTASASSEFLWRSVLLKQQIEHGHEMAFTAAETAEQVTRLAGFPFECVAHE